MSRPCGSWGFESSSSHLACPLVSVGGACFDQGKLGPRTCCSLRMQLQGGPWAQGRGVPGLTCCSLRMQLQGASLGDRGVGCLDWSYLHSMSLQWGKLSS